MVTSLECSLLESKKLSYCLCPCRKGLLLEKAGSSEKQDGQEEQKSQEWKEGDSEGPGRLRLGSVPVGAFRGRSVCVLKVL